MAGGRDYAGLISSLPAALIIARKGKAEFLHAPEELLSGGEKAKVERHLLSCLAAGESVPPLELAEGKKLAGFAVSKKGGRHIALCYDATGFWRREKTLIEQIEQLDKFRKLAVGRELAIKELKTHIQILKNSIEGTHG